MQGSSRWVGAARDRRRRRARHEVRVGQVGRARDGRPITTTCSRNPAARRGSPRRSAAATRGRSGPGPGSRGGCSHSREAVTIVLMLTATPPAFTIAEEGGRPLRPGPRHRIATKSPMRTPSFARSAVGHPVHLVRDLAERHRPVGAVQGDLVPAARRGCARARRRRCSRRGTSARFSSVPSAQRGRSVVGLRVSR